MGFDYGRMRGAATRLLSHFNQGTVTIRRVTTGTPVEPGEPGPEVVTLTTAHAVGVRVAQAFSPGTLVIERGDVLTISPRGKNEAGANVEVDITNDDLIAVEGDYRAISDIKRIPPMGTLVCWKVKVAD